jgi:hypothetical protein
MDQSETLGIVGVPPGLPLARSSVPKTYSNKRNRKSTLKSTTNPRTPKPPKSSPLTQIWEGNHSPKNHEGFPQISLIKSPRARSRKHPEKNTKRELRKITTKNNREQHIQTLRNHDESSIHATKVHTRSSLPPDHPTLSTRSHHEALKLVLWKS